jgi:hypothetical protein
VSSGGYSGGLAGYLEFPGGDPSGSDQVIDYSYATGSVTIATTSGGGLVGSIIVSDNGILTVKRSFAMGNVSGNENVGGFAGDIRNNTADNELTIEECFARGDVDATQYYNGGFAGNIYPTNSDSKIVIQRTYATGTASTANSGDYAGFATQNLYAEGTLYFYNNFYNSDYNPLSPVWGATGKTTTAMKTANTYSDEGWSIQENGTSLTWATDTKQIKNEGYPYISGLDIWQ